MIMFATEQNVGRGTILRKKSRGKFAEFNADAMTLRCFRGKKRKRQKGTRLK